MHPATAVTALLAAGAALAIVWAPSAPQVSTRTTGPAASSAVDVRNADPRTVLVLARRCLDARHVSLVAHALERGRPLTVAQARRWCEDSEGREWQGTSP